MTAIVKTSSDFFHLKSCDHSVRDARDPLRCPSTCGQKKRVWAKSAFCGKKLISLGNFFYSSSRLSQLVMLTRAGDAPLPESTDNGVSEVRYITELVPSSPAKEPQRRRTRLQSRRAACALHGPNVFSDSESDVVAGAVPGRRTAGSSTTSA